MGISNLEVVKPISDYGACGHTWWAPYIHPSGREGRMEQICILHKNHEGDHRSRTKVTSANHKTIRYK